MTVVDAAASNKSQSILSFGNYLLLKLIAN